MWFRFYFALIVKKNYYRVNAEGQVIELERKNDSKEYVAKMLISDKLKSYIGNDIFIDNDPPIYLYYPEVFYAAFESDSKKNRMK